MSSLKQFPEVGLPGLYNRKNERLGKPFEGVALLPNELQFLISSINEYIRNKKQIFYLEYGSGASTIYLDKLFNDYVRQKIINNFRICSIETRGGWINKVNEHLSTKSKVYIKEDYKLKKNSCNIIMIDGKNRMQCCKDSKGLIVKGGFVFLHDYETRLDELRQLLTVYNKLKIVETLARFQN